MDRKQYLEGYLLAFCDSIDYAVKNEIFDEDDMAVKVADYIREYIEEVNKIISGDGNAWINFESYRKYYYTPYTVYITCDRCGATYQKGNSHLCIVFNASSDTKE